MNSFELNILAEQERAGSDFMSRVVNEIRRAFALEKSSRKITQQAIAEKIGTSRAVVNRQIQGLENLSARRIGELLWAIGWEPHFEARKIPVRENIFIPKMDDVAPHKAPAKPFQQLTKIGSNVEIQEIRTN
jgi:HTH domain